jgi:predicted phage tail protein
MWVAPETLRLGERSVDRCLERFRMKPGLKETTTSSNSEKRVNPMLKTRNLGKQESVIRTILGGILIVLSFFITGIFWLGVGLIGAIVVVSAIFKY